MTACNGPRDVPDLRLWLLEQWAPTGIFTRAEYLRVVDERKRGIAFDVIGRGDSERTAVNVRWNTENLRSGALWWVSADMVDLMLAAINGVPDDVLLDDLTIPSPSGLVVLEKPWIGVDSDADSACKVDAFVWGSTYLPAIDNPALRRQDEPVNAISVECYTRLPEKPDWWGPLGRSDWPLPDALNDRPWDMTDERWASFAEDRRVLAAFWTFVSQEGIADCTEQRPERPVRRRMERAGLPPSHVKVVTMRRVHRVASNGESTSDRNYSHRWWVNGFWRNQAYGPNHSLRRLRYVRPHVRGPEDKPFIPKDTVNVWKR